MSWSLLSLVMPDIKQNYLDESRETKSIAYVLYLNEYLATPTIFPTFRKGFWVLLMGLIGWRACFHHQKWTNTTKFKNNKIDREKKKWFSLEIIYLKLSLTFNNNRQLPCSISSVIILASILSIQVEGQHGTDQLYDFTYIYSIS